ncbi:hypothetical protein MMC17_000926 [Xylographa soralifera]|nr:hypothetical protein [Xylographa soralifera]
MQDSPYLRALVPDNLRALELEIRSNSFTAQFFQKRGSVPSLDTLVWYTDHPEEVYLLDFLRDNTHLSRLDLPYSQTEIFLETQLLPLLASSFTRLTSLSLCWSHSYISLSGLELIGTLHSLQQIYLHVAEDEGSMPDWLNHHRAIQPFLGQLTCLRKLAFGGSFCDYTTPSVLSPSVSVDEDIDSAQPDEDTIPAERDEDNHEDLHEQQVLSLANEYVPLLPELEWLYIGQLQMHVAGGSEPEHRSARIFPQAGRTPYHTALQQWTLIRDLFGREKDF